MTEPEVQLLLLELKGAFPAGAMNEATMPVYAKHLADLDAGYARQAAAQLIQTRKQVTLPTVGEIRCLALALDPTKQKLKPGESPPPPPGCTGWLELRTDIGDSEGPYQLGEATDGWWYEFHGHVPVRKKPSHRRLTGGGQ